VKAPAATLRRALAERPTGRIREICRQRPANITAARTLAWIEPLVQLPLDRAEAPTAEALNGVFRAHTRLIRNLTSD
jgi:hypothetical protein